MLEDIARTYAWIIDTGTKRPPTSRQCGFAARLMKERIDSDAARFEVIKRLFNLSRDIQSTKELTRGQVEALIEINQHTVYGQMLDAYIQEQK